MIASLAAWVLLGLGISLIAATVGAYAPGLYGARLRTQLSFAGMLLVLLLPYWMLVGGVTAAVLVWLGAAAHWAGRIGLALHGVGWALLVAYGVRMQRARPLLDGVAVLDVDQPFTAGLTDDERGQLAPGQGSWRPALTHRLPSMLRVTVERGLVFRQVAGRRLKVDIYRLPERAHVGPSLVYIHGGAWVMGTRRQSRFMMYELAAAGFTVFAISYRLAPRFSLADAVEDCKAGLAWVRAHAGEHGGRTDRVLVMGGSAGGHLAALLALTPGRAELQPPTETDASDEASTSGSPPDTRVDGAVLLYPVPDLEAVFGERPDRAMARMLERVIKARYAVSPERFTALSPSSYLGSNAPPILLVHGTHDFVVPIEESRVFQRRLLAAGARTVHLLEVPFGQHAFEVFPSPLHQRTVRVIARFIDSLDRTAQAPPPPPPRALD